MKLKLKSKTITLRYLKNSDAQSIYENAKDKEITKYTTLPHPYKLKYACDFIKITAQKYKTKKALELGIELNQTKKIIGIISLMNIDPKNRNVELGYWLGKKYWNRGIMKEAVKLIVNYGFKNLKLVRIYAKVRHPNIASVKLLEKSGFKYEGRARKSIFKDEKWFDHLLYSKLSTD